jgi:hypothetical protein
MPVLAFGIALHADGLPGTLAGACVGGCALATDRQAAQVTHAPVAFDALEAFEVQTDLAAQVAFDHILALLDRMHDLGQLLLVEVFGPERGIDLGALENRPRVHRPDAVDVAQGDVNAFPARNVYP